MGPKGPPRLVVVLDCGDAGLSCLRQVVNDDLWEL